VLWCKHPILGTLKAKKQVMRDQLKSVTSPDQLELTSLRGW
jgi:hypothetical protein